MPPPELSATTVPLPSFMCHEPTRPAAELTSLFIVDWI